MLYLTHRARPTRHRRFISMVIVSKFVPTCLISSSVQSCLSLDNRFGWMRYANVTIRSIEETRSLHGWVLYTKRPKLSIYG